MPQPSQPTDPQGQDAPPRAPDRREITDEVPKKRRAPHPEPHETGEFRIPRF